MKFNLSVATVFALLFSGLATAEDIGGFEVGSNYLCAIETAKFVSLTSDSSGEWKNAPSSLRIKISACTNVSEVCNMLPSSRDLYELNVTSRKAGKFQKRSFLLHSGSYAFGAYGMIDLDERMLFWTKQDTSLQTNDFAAFSLSAACFEAD